MGDSSEAGGASSSAALPGVGLPRGGPAPRSRWHLGSRSGVHRGGGLRGESHGLGSRAIFGCSYRRSVAEIGREASSLCRRGEPRGEPRGRRVGRRGGSPRTRRAGSRGSKGCGARERRRTVIANGLGEAARSFIQPIEGVLGAACRGLKQASTRAYPGVTEVAVGLYREVKPGGVLVKVGVGAPA